MLNERPVESKLLTKSYIVLPVHHLQFQTCQYTGYYSSVFFWKMSGYVLILLVAVSAVLCQDNSIHDEDLTITYSQKLALDKVRNDKSIKKVSFNKSHANGKTHLAK